MTPYVVALTGGIGSGKSTVAKAFSKLSVPLVDADLISRQVVRPNSSILRIIAQRCGPTILRADGSLDRSALRERVFSDARAKSWLNGLLHPLIQQRTAQQVCSVHAPYVLWVVPLLIENNLQYHANRVLVVDVAPEIQIARTLGRDAVSCVQVENILKAQASRQQRLFYADDIIDNNRHPEEIIDQVSALHQRYLVLVASASRQDKAHYIRQRCCV